MLPRMLRKYRRNVAVIIIITFFVIILCIEFLNSSKMKLIHPKHIYRGNQEEYVDKHGIQVVIGHYIGNSVQKIPNATYDMVNKNNFNPEANAGKNGQPVMTAPKDLILMQQLFQINKFNLLVSDRIPLNRSLPDVRRKKCSFLFQNINDYPKASVIIVFHNEAWSTLLRTVWSVINRSPASLLEEIILVDDASEREFLKKDLDDYIKLLPIKTKLLRSAERIGLIKARLKGANIAKGQVLTFLDAHCECTKGWLEPLLHVIKNNRKIAVCPIIDIINDSTFAYVKSFELHWGAFNWNLQFRWYTLGGEHLMERKVDATQAFDTPAMAGGLFAIDRDYFFEIGSYDEGMNIWGGENLELSFRIWQCGGKIQIAPCSRVGHLFRKSSPYTFPGGIGKTLFANLARVADVWMDEWAKFYFKFNPESKLVEKEQNVTSRLLLRQELRCRNFEWYLDNVWPEHFFPKKDRFFGRIRNLEANWCLKKPDSAVISNQPVGEAVLESCILKPEISMQLFVMTKEGFIMTDDSICLDAPEKENVQVAKVRIMACSRMSRQKWVYNNVTKELRHFTNQKCLDVPDIFYMKKALVLHNCDGTSTQKWALDEVLWTD